MEGEITAAVCCGQEELQAQWKLLLASQFRELERVLSAGEQIKAQLAETYGGTTTKSGRKRAVPGLKNFLVMWTPQDQQLSAEVVRLRTVPVTHHRCEEGPWYFLVRCRSKTEAQELVRSVAVPRKKSSQCSSESSSSSSPYTVAAAEPDAMQAWCEVVPTLWNALLEGKDVAGSVVDKIRLQSVRGLFQVHNFKRQDREVKETFRFYGPGDTLQGRTLAVQYDQDVEHEAFDWEAAEAEAEAVGSGAAGTLSSLLEQYGDAMGEALSREWWDVLEGGAQ